MMVVTTSRGAIGQRVFETVFGSGEFICVLGAGAGGAVLHGHGARHFRGGGQRSRRPAEHRRGPRGRPHRVRVSDAMAGEFVDVVTVTAEGFGNAVARLPRSCTTTTVWWWWGWCGEVVQPVVEASVPQRSLCRRP